MTGFLANLAGLALGQPPAGAARLSLPPRFSGGGQIATDTDLEQIEIAPAIAPNPSLAVESSRQTEARRETPVTAIVETAPVPTCQSAELSVPRTPSPTTHQAETPRPFGRAMLHRHSSSRSPISEHRVVTQFELGVAAPATPKPSVHTETVVRQVRKDVSSPQAAPLSQATLANRAVVEREPRPVVNVTIDRIEVRAPREAQQPQPPRRAKPQPSVSLADYLGVRS